MTTTPAPAALSIPDYDYALLALPRRITHSTAYPLPHHTTGRRPPSPAAQSHEHTTTRRLVGMFVSWYGVCMLLVVGLSVVDVAEKNFSFSRNF